MKNLIVSALLLTISTSLNASEISNALSKKGTPKSITTLHCKVDEVPSGSALLLFNRFEIKVFRGNKGRVYKSTLKATTSFSNGQSVEKSLEYAYEIFEGSANFLNLSNVQKWKFNASYFIESDFKEEGGDFANIKIDRETGRLSSKQKVEVRKDTIGVFKITTEPCIVYATEVKS